MNKKNRYQCRIRKIHIIISVIFLVGSFLFVYCSKPKVYRIGVLSGLNNFEETTDGFKEGMTDLGYIDEKNITYDVQKTDFDIPAYDRILKKFVKDIKKICIINVTFPPFHPDVEHNFSSIEYGVINLAKSFNLKSHIYLACSCDEKEIGIKAIAAKDNRYDISECPYKSAIYGDINVSIKKRNIPDEKTIQKTVEFNVSDIFCL